MSTEPEAFAAFHEHVGGCLVCRPALGLVCEQGRHLHDVWRQAADAGVAQVKRENENREHSRPVRQAASRRRDRARRGGLA